MDWSVFYRIQHVMFNILNFPKCLTSPSVTTIQCPSQVTAGLLREDVVTLSSWRWSVLPFCIRDYHFLVEAATCSSKNMPSEPKMSWLHLLLDPLSSYEVHKLWKPLFSSQGRLNLQALRIDTTAEKRKEEY